MVDWADLDGAVPIANDIFNETTTANGKAALTTRPGRGVVASGA